MAALHPIWNDSDVVILGGGTSLPRQFGIPEQLLSDARSGAVTPVVLGTYIRPHLQGKHVIGCNAAYLLGDFVDIVYFHDIEFYENNIAGLEKFPGRKITCNSFFKDKEGIEYLKKDIGKPFGISKKRDSLSWNHNSGASAINLARHLGAKRILLFGFDMQKNEAHHFHGTYKLKDTPPYGRFMVGTQAIKQDAEREGIEIININTPEFTALTTFKLGKLEDYV